MTALAANELNGSIASGPGTVGASANSTLEVAELFSQNPKRVSIKIQCHEIDSNRVGGRVVLIRL